MLLLARIFFPALLPLRSPAVPCISSSKAPHEHHWNVLCACRVVTWIMEIGILSPASCKSFLFSPSSSAVSCCTLHFIKQDTQEHNWDIICTRVVSTLIMEVGIPRSLWNSLALEVFQLLGPVVQCLVQFLERLSIFHFIV